MYFFSQNAECAFFVFITASVVILIKMCIAQSPMGVPAVNRPRDYSGKFDQKLNLTHDEGKLHHFRGFLSITFALILFSAIKSFPFRLPPVQFFKNSSFSNQMHFRKCSRGSSITLFPFSLSWSFLSFFSCFVEILFTRTLLFSLLWLRTTFSYRVSIVSKFLFTLFFRKRQRYICE